jgi:hypothetical protein
VGARASTGVEILAFAALTIGATHLPATWGEVCPWIVGGLSGLIIADKLSA